MKIIQYYSIIFIDRLNNDLKESINSKSKQLAAEIKLVNSLKVQDIAKIEESIKSSLISKDKKDSKKETQVENIQTKSNKETVENKAKPNTLTATTLVQKKEVEITNENPLQPDEGGNTEVRFNKSLQLHLKPRFNRNLLKNREFYYYFLIFLCIILYSIDIYLY